MNTDPVVPPLLFVREPAHEDAVHPLACPVWLGEPTARCEVAPITA